MATVKRDRDAVVEVEPVAAAPRWKYTGPVERVYTTVPVTVRPGEVMEWPVCPGTDGCWVETDEPVSIVPDPQRHMFPTSADQQGGVTGA